MNTKKYVFFLPIFIGYFDKWKQPQALYFLKLKTIVFSKLNILFTVVVQVLVNITSFLYICKTNLFLPCNVLVQHCTVIYCIIIFTPLPTWKIEFLANLWVCFEKLNLVNWTLCILPGHKTLKLSLLLLTLFLSLKFSRGEIFPGWQSAKENRFNKSNDSNYVQV